MSKEKQIDEMQNALIAISKSPIMIDGLEYWSDTIAEALYNAGYRKVSNVVDEIIDYFIEKVCDKYEVWTVNDELEYHYVYYLMEEVKIELKNKYTEGEKNDA